MVCILVNVCIPFAEAAPIEMIFSEAINDTFENETEIVSDDVLADEEITVEVEIETEESQAITDNATTDATRVIVLYKDSSGNKIEANNVTAINDDIDVITLENGTDILSYMTEVANSNDNIKLIQPDYELELAAVSDNWSFQNDAEIKAQFVKKETYDASDNTDYNYKKSYHMDSQFKKATKNNTGKDVKIAILDTAVNTESDEANMSHGTAINNLIVGIVPEAEIISFDIFRDGKAYIIALRWENVDLIDGYIYVENGYINYYDYNDGKTHQKYDSLPKTVSSERRIPINDMVHDVLLVQQELQKGQSSEFVFTDRWNRPLKYINVHNSLENLIKRINITLQNSYMETSILFPKVTTHYFRHTFATMCLEREIHPRTVQEYLGHSNYLITMNTYSHVSKKTGRTGMSKFNYAL